MKFGVFYELQLPRPWEPGAELRLMQQSLEQVAQADRAGFDYVWAVEHHFLEEYAHSSAPEVFLAACSQRTSTIRLGHGIVLLPPPYNHPARVAERIASLDLVSNGRVEFGSGESSSAIELGGFMVPHKEKRELWQESLTAICRMFVEEPFGGYRGSRLRMPARNVVPKPVQKPHPPLWVACSQRDTIKLAARLGIGALSFAFITPEEARQWVNEYRETFARECVPIGYAVNPQIAIVLPMMCAESEQQAHAAGDRGFGFFTYALGHYYFFGRHTPGVTNIFNEYQANAGTTTFAPTATASCIGTPDQIHASLLAYEQAGVDQVAFVMQAGNNRHEDICAALELFAREVMPEFKQRETAQAPARQAALAPLIEEVMGRKQTPAGAARKRPVTVKSGRGGVF